MKRQKSKTPVTYGGFKFDFWLENKINQHFELNEVEIKERFSTWLKTKETAWINGMRSERIIIEFITAKDALNSVNEPKQIDGIVSVLYPLICIEEKSRLTPIDKIGDNFSKFNG